MKKKFGIVFAALALVVAMVATLCACSNYGTVKKAFEKEGYEEVEISQEYKDTVAEFVGEEYADKVEIHVLQKKSDDSSILGGALSALDVVVIVEFKGDKDMVDSLKDKFNISEEDVKDAYNELQKLDNVSGTCVLVIGTNPNSAQIFKGTK